MLSNGFKINECDKCVYVKQTQNCFAILCLYVDDMLITGSNGETVKKIKCFLFDVGQHFFIQIWVLL